MTAASQTASLGLRSLSMYYRLRGVARRVLGREKTVYIWKRTDDYRQMWETAARDVGAELVPLDENTWEIRRNGRSTRIVGWQIEMDNPVVLRIAGNKILSYQLLSEAGLPVPAYRVFRLNQLDRVADFMAQHPGRMFVIKPASGTSSGRGVTTHIRTFKQARKAAALAAGYGGELLIETLVPGEVYRLLYLDGELLYASRRNGIRMTGDGQLSIRQWLEQENARRRESGEPLIEPDIDMEATLAVQDLNLDSRIEADRNILLKSVANRLDDNEEIRTVYDENVTEDICDSLREQGKRAARAVRGKFVGVDMITLDHRVGLEDGQGVIGEVNTTPGMHHHQNLINSDRTPSAAARVLDYLLEHGYQETP